MGRPCLSVFVGLGLTVLIAFSMESNVFGEESDKWIQLFNGRDLGGWTPKFRGHKLGENYLDTFRVENGLLKVCYDQYETFDDKFGHLFYKEPFSHYILRAEYRVVGHQVPGAPEWAVRNNGFMLHGQTPETMRLDQDFPVCIEVQLLGGDGTHKRTTGNLCTPGTHVVIEGKLRTQHCVNSSSPTFHGDQWVTVQAEVHGNRLIRHFINGELVLEYSQPQLDDSDPDAQRMIAAGLKQLEQGTISLQAESHPFEFRKIELRQLSPQ